MVTPLLRSSHAARASLPKGVGTRAPSASVLSGGCSALVPLRAPRFLGLRRISADVGSSRLAGSVVETAPHAAAVQRIVLAQRAVLLDVAARGIAAVAETGLVLAQRVGRR